MRAALAERGYDLVEPEGGSDDDDDGPSGGVPVPLYVRVDEDKPTPYNEDRGQQRY